MWIASNIVKPKEGTMLELNLLGQALFITQIDGQLFCADNLCPHENLKLTLGCLKGKRVKCSLHGFSFDLENQGDSGEVDVDNLQTYKIKEQDGNIFIDLPETLAKAPH